MLQELRGKSNVQHQSTKIKEYKKDRKQHKTIAPNITTYLIIMRLQAIPHRIAAAEGNMCSIK